MSTAWLACAFLAVGVRGEPDRVALDDSSASRAFSRPKSAADARVTVCTTRAPLKLFADGSWQELPIGTIVEVLPRKTEAWARVRTTLGAGKVNAEHLHRACRARQATTSSSHLAGKSYTTTGPMAERRLTLVRREVGHLSPKSIVAAPNGRVFAQNMVYQHSVTVFDADGNRLRDISDRVPRSLLGLPGKGFVRGGPVEGAVSPDGKSFYVSNYSVFGAGLAGEARDSCDSPVPRSFVYEIDVETLEIKRALPVGAVPKFLATTHDGKHLVVSNWCGGTISIVDLSGAAPTIDVRVGSLPRGIAIEADDSIAYVASMGSNRIAVVDLNTHTVLRKLKPGHGPRHLVLDQAGRLFVSLCSEGRVAEIDKESGAVLAAARTGRDPRSMALSSDGTALYVANYGEDSLAVVDARSMKVVQKVATGPSPIGVAFEASKERVWVSCYGGSVRLYDSQGAMPHKSVKSLTDEALRFP